MNSHFLAFQPIMTQIERNGITVDLKRRAALISDLEAVLKRYSNEVQKLAPVECRKILREYKTTPKAFKCSECMGRGAIAEPKAQSEVRGYESLGSTGSRSRVVGGNSVGSARSVTTQKPNPFTGAVHEIGSKRSEAPNKRKPLRAPYLHLYHCRSCNDWVHASQVKKRKGVLTHVVPKSRSAPSKKARKDSKTGELFETLPGSRAVAGKDHPIGPKPQERWGRAPSWCVACGGKGFHQDKLEEANSLTAVREKDPGEFILLRDAEDIDLPAQPKFIFRCFFNPNSDKQLIAYFEFKGIPVPLDPKTKKPTTGEKSIRKYRKDPLVGAVLRFKKVFNAITEIKGYEPDEDGRIHARLTFFTGTGRLSCRDPNLMKVRKREKDDDPQIMRDMRVAARTRQCFVARPGYRLVEIDYSSIEALMLGVLAEDDYFVRCCRKSIHAILSSYALCEDREQPSWTSPIDLNTWSDSDVHEAIRDIKDNFKTLYDRMKRTIYLSGYGGTEFMMVLQAPRDFPSRKIALASQHIFFETLGSKIWDWQIDTLWDAHVKGYLDSPYKYRRYFYDVLRYDRSLGANGRYPLREEVMAWKGRFRPEIRGGRYGKWGGDAKEALAFPPSNCALGYLKDGVRNIALHDPERLRQVWMLIHDAVCFEIPDGPFLMGSVRRLCETLSHESAEMGGLRVGVEAEVGGNWGPYLKGDPSFNPQGMREVYELAVAA